MTSRRAGRRTGRPGIAPRLPAGPVPISTGVAEVVLAPDRHLATLLVNGVPSSCLGLDDPTWLEFEYHQQMAAVVDRMAPGPLRAIHLGAGACSFPRWVDAVRPGSRQLAVDVDASLVELVRRWFDLPRAPALRLRAQDARETLASLPGGSADLVVRDVFDGDKTPADLLIAETARAVGRTLRPHGLYLVNCADSPPLPRARAEVATLRAALGPVLVVAETAVMRGRRYGNLVLAAGGEHAIESLDLSALQRRLRSLPVPARLLDPAEAADFAGSAAVLRAEPGPVPPGPVALAGHDEAAPPGDAARS
ncbi:MAG TPA: fused MFS/spermidine synthase [Actinotalea sp.]|nr:fused MFS/spermidine synthase [Actinotalea sp.]